VTAAKHSIDRWLARFNQWKKPQNFLRFNGEVFCALAVDFEATNIGK
jgi:hypothetical protein